MERYQGMLLVWLLFLSLPAVEPEPINPHNVQHWAKKLGMELWWFGSYVTRRDELLHKYKQSAELAERSGSALVQELAREVKNMMDLKISAVKRIMDAAENTAMSHSDDTVSKDYDYWNAKAGSMPECPDALRKAAGKSETHNLVLTENSHFYGVPVNTSVSSVHVPTNVYDRTENVLRAIKWSENLDDIFTNNYRMDPSLSWQYFGSSFGFMRQYPASQWSYDYGHDLYDCRTRGWYIEAATSAKDIIILVDNSGSMTGDRKEIARHVVNNILDTLGNNDFVNIYTFSEETQELVECFRDKLVQATLGNVRELKLAMENLTTKDIANFTSALSKAFDILQMAREEHLGAMCNQAIMLITDGVPFTYEEVFQEYNWKEKPLRYPVRVFTYLIGLEVPDVSQVKWMACENQGYYVHLSTLAEVREQVLKYIQVMARPMVLHRTEHPVVWTPVYADVKDPKMTDWQWEEKERSEQKERFESFRKNWRKFNTREEQDRRFVKKLKRTQDQSSSKQGFQLMTTVSMPVFDRRENATRIGELLGVAGTDVPIEDIIKLMSPHQIGVNGYAFIITNNGFILTHPDMRPLFQSILKPSYNSIDLSEVELMDTDDMPRELTDAMKAFRDAVINQSTGTVTLNTRYHFDDMRRAGRIRRHYYYTGIENTPFTLVVALPDQYGSTRVHGVEEIRRSVLQGTQVVSYFKGKNWRIHPDWIYCKYHYDTEHPFDSPEHELIHFLERAQEQQPHWKWPLNRFPTPPERLQANATDGKSGKVNKDSYFCDRQLLLSLLFDAKITEGFSLKLNSPPSDDQGKEMQEQVGITASFVSTRTGLTRWHDNPLNLDMTDQLLEEHPFGDQYNRAIDELWYKRAVEHYLVQPESFVYSVPHDIGYHNDTLVTASNALFLTANERKAPLAVLGFQFLQSAFFSRFMNITSKCLSAGSVCHRTCASDNVACFILDNNGYIVLSSKSLRDTGHFFGEVQGYIMASMVEEKIYEKIQIFDYQAVCFDPTATENSAPFKFSSPWGFIKALVDWTIARTFWLFAQTNLQTLWHTVYSFATEEVYSENYEETGVMTDGEARPDVMRVLKMLTINRTRPQACDKKVDLFQLSVRPRVFDKPTRPNDKSRRIVQPGINNRKYDPTAGCTRPFLVEYVDASNLILVVVDEQCDIPEMVMTVLPTNVDYMNMSAGWRTLACYRVDNNVLPRKRLSACINHHPKESEITLCGRAGPSIVPGQVLLAVVLTTLWLYTYRAAVM